MSVAKRFMVMFMALAACLAAAVCMAPRAAAGQRFTIAYTGGIGVYPRSGPSMGSQRVGAALPEGSSVEVACELEGELVDNNTTPATKIWERLSDGTHIPNAYINSGADGWTPGVPRCDQSPDPQPKENASAYNPVAAANWAKEHAYDTPRFSGNDCTWFVSQALWNGGMQKTDRWTDYSTDDEQTRNGPKPGPTRAARLADDLFHYLTSSGQVKLKQISWSDNTAAGAEVGDLIFYNLNMHDPEDLDHVAIVTGINSDGYPVISQHTAGARDKYWSWSEAYNTWIEKAYHHEKYGPPKAYLIKIKK